MSNRKAVIFDLDGTLLDTITDIADSMNDVLARNGFPTHEREAYLSFVGHGMDVLVKLALPGGLAGEEALPRLVPAMREEYARRWRDSSRPYPGIPELLDDLARRGVSCAVLSNKLDSFTKEMVRALLGKWDFVAVRGLDFNRPRKPDPAQALEIAQAMGLDPGQICFMGDSGIDMETATRAGMFPVGVLWGYQTRAQILSGGAAALLEKPGELLAYLGQGACA